MAAGADAEVVGGLRNLEFTEKDVGHILVVVLAGVDKNFFAARRLAEPA